MAESSFHPPADLDEYFKLAKEPLVASTTMTAEMREEVVDACVQARRPFEI